MDTLRPLVRRRAGTGRATGIQRDAHDEAFLQPLVQQARDALGAEPFTSAERDGRQLRTAGTRDELRAWLAAGVLSLIPC
jgi:hypothetical protein